MLESLLLMSCIYKSYPEGAMPVLKFIALAAIFAAASASAAGETKPNEASCAAYDMDALEGYAAQGNANAMYLMGELYRTGQCAPRDFARAFDHLHGAATRGHVRAIYALSLVYSDEANPGADPARAMDLLGLAARSGLSDAQHRLGVILAARAETEAERGVARDWLIEAYEGGHGLSAASLGMFYHHGMHGFPVDDCRAFDWYTAALSAGFEGARGPREAVLTRAQGRCAHIY